MRFAPSGFSAPTPIDPSAPAFDTPAAMAGVDTPAMGAWMMGWCRSRVFRNTTSDLGLVWSLSGQLDRLSVRRSVIRRAPRLFALDQRDCVGEAFRYNQ